MVLSPQQKMFSDQFSALASNGVRNFSQLYLDAKKALLPNEYKELEQVLMSAEVLILSLDRLKAQSLEGDELRGWLSSFSCNMVTGGIGATWGTMATGVLTLSVTVPVAGFIGGGLLPL